MVCKNLKEFEERWKKITNEIKEKEISITSAGYLNKFFLDEILVFSQYKEDKGKEGKIIQAMIEINNDLHISLAMAIANYEKIHKKSFLEKIFGKEGFKPKDISLIKNSIT